jgi:hypothetical protein
MSKLVLKVMQTLRLMRTCKKMMILRLIDLITQKSM